MSADLVSDPAILTTYHELRNPDAALNWMFLGYDPAGSKDKLTLSDSGDSGLEGLKATLSTSNALNIHFGLLRLEGRFLLFTLLPDNTGGVKRARALVHSRAVGTKLQHQATLTISKPSDLTLNSVRSKLKLDTGSAPSSLPSSPNPQVSAGAGTSLPSPYLQPSPLRSHFQQQQEQNTNGSLNPPTPPEKDVHTLSKIRSNNSMRSFSTPPFSPPLRQSSREHAGSSPPLQQQQQPQTNGNGYNYTNGNHRQVSASSIPSLHTSPPPPVGLGFSNENQQYSSPHTSNGQSDSIPTRPYATTSAYTQSYSGSPRLGPFENGYEQGHRRLASGPSAPGPPSPALGNVNGYHHHHPLQQQGPPSRPISPAASTSSRQSGANKQFANDNRPQDLPLPLSASPSVPNSARSLDPATLDSMFRPSESQESFQDDAVYSASSHNGGSRVPSSSSIPPEEERIAVAEQIARAAEARWQAEQRRESGDQSDNLRYANAPVDDYHSADSQCTPMPGKHERNPMEDADASVAGLTNGFEHATIQSSGDVREHNHVQEGGDGEHARLGEVARQAEMEQERGREAAEAEQHSRRMEAEDAEASRKRQEADAAAAAEAEAERLRLEAEAESERLRLEAEAAEETERQRQEAEEAERKRVEDEEAERRRIQEEAEAERKRQEEAKIAEEHARLEAIETAKREKEAVKQRARDDLRERVSSGNDEAALTGFLSVQGGSSILWRRRYFQMSGQSLKLYKKDKETSKPPIDEVILSGNHVKTIDENAEDLMAIPHSFKLNFIDYDEEPYLFYCDEEEDKELLLFGLKVAAKLI